MIVKNNPTDFDSPGGALTLPQNSVTKEDFFISGFHSRRHSSGWIISAWLQSDYYVWVNEFVAIHPKLGVVCGNFENQVCATSEEGFQHFWKHHQPEAWDYQDI